MANMKNKKIDAYLIISWIIGFIALAITIFPMFFLVSNSVKPNLEIYNTVRILPSHVIWDNYKNLFGDKQTIHIIFNSILITMITTILSVFLGSFASYGLNKLGKSKIATIVAILIIIVRFYPKVTIVLPYFLFIKSIGMMDTLFSVILSHVSMTLPITILLMMTFYSSVPKEIEESANMDGASIFETYFKIVMPITAGGMAATAILVAMFSWNEFLMASSVASSSAITLPIAIAGFITDKGTDLGIMSALSVITIIPMVIFILFTQRYIVRGMTAGAVKG